MRGVSLEEISAATRISTRFLEAIENEQWEQLPGGVFNRGFIRSIARFLGLDEDSLVAEYALETQAESENVSAAPPLAEIPRNWRPLALFLAGLLLAVGLLAYLFLGARIASWFHHRPAGTALHTAGTDATSVTFSLAGPEAGNKSPVASGNPASAAAGAPPGSEAPGALVLKVEAGKPTQVKILADGKIVFDGAVHANDVQRFRAQQAFEVTASDASALLLELNGQTVPPIGPPGQLGSVTLTRADLKPGQEETH